MPARRMQNFSIHEEWSQLVNIQQLAGVVSDVSRYQMYHHAVLELQELPAEERHEVVEAALEDYGTPSWSSHPLGHRVVAGNALGGQNGSTRQSALYHVAVGMGW